jgi:hypothetical protein
VPYNASNSYTGTFTPTRTGYLYAWVNSPDNPDNRLSRITGLFVIRVYGVARPPALPAAPRGKGANLNSAFSATGPVRSSFDPTVEQGSIKGLCGLLKRGRAPRRGTSFATSRSFGSITYRDTAVNADNDSGKLSTTWRCTGGGRYTGGSREKVTFDVVSTRTNRSDTCERDTDGTLTVVNRRTGTDEITLTAEDCERTIRWLSNSGAFGIRVQAQVR